MEMGTQTVLGKVGGGVGLGGAFFAHDVLEHHATSVCVISLLAISACVRAIKQGPNTANIVTVARSIIPSV